MQRSPQLDPVPVGCSEPAEPSVHQLGRYQLLRRLGSGGMAEVYLAREPLPGGLSKLLVLKKIRPAFARAPAFRRMFEEEAKIAVNLNHPCVVQTFGYGHIGDVYYLAMEHVDGIDLLRLLQLARAKGQAVSPSMAAFILCQVCQGLDYAHRKCDEQGEPLWIVHRDVSPQNMLLSWDGAVKLADFGIARARGTQEDEGLLKGKYAYMSPEQAAGEPLDHRSDVFSVGVVLWEVLTGQPLFSGLGMRDAITAVRDGRVPPVREFRPDLPAALEEITLRALRVRREERYQTARDLHRDLSRFFFAESAARGEVVDAGRLAAYLAQLVPPARRRALLQGPADPQDAAPPAPSGAETNSLRRVADSLGQLCERQSVLIIEGVLRGAGRGDPALAAFLQSADRGARQRRAEVARLDEGGFTFLLGMPQEEEHHAEGALQLALEQLAQAARLGPAALQLAVALHRGTAYTQRRTGETPPLEVSAASLEAARALARSARPGEVVVASGIYRALRGSWRFAALETTPTDVLQEDAGRAYRLLAPTLRGEPGPRPLVLVGRHDELMHLHQALGASEQAPCRALVLGEVGMGKRALLAAFRQSLEPARYLALQAAVTGARRGAAYALLQDLARDLLGLGEHADAAEVERHLEAAARLPAHTASLVGALRRLLYAPEPGAQDAVRELLRGLRGDRVPVLTVAEVQWADVPSLLVLEDLRRHGEIALCVYSGRPLPEWPPDIAEILRGEPTDMVITLTGLSAAEQEEVVLGRLDPAVRVAAGPLCQGIIEKADGNPLYLHEFLDALVERGALQPGPAGLLWDGRALDLAVPPAVEAAIAARLGRLPEQARACLVILALCQRAPARVEPALLQALLGQDPQPALEFLSEAGLVRRGDNGALIIPSPLVQDVAVATLQPEDRRLLQEQLLLLLASEAQTHIARTDIACSAARIP